MNSRASKTGLEQLRAMPREARESLAHVANNGLCIIRGLAEQIREDASKAEFNEARASTIVRTVDELSRQLREMTQEESNSEKEKSCLRQKRDL